MSKSKIYFQLSIIIPTLNNFNGLSYQLNYFKNKPYKIIIIDNAPDEKKRKLIKKFKNSPITYLPQKKNLGFAAAVNLGVKDVQTKWMLILNDDIEFTFKNSKFQISRDKQVPNSKKQIKNKEIIARLVKFAEENKLDAVSPILRNPDGKVENYGYKLLPYGRIRLVKKLESLKVEKLDGLTAACLLIKTSVFNNLGGFDESFFAYLEDVDFFLRFKKAGYKLSIDLNTQVVHHHMATSKTMGSFKARQDVVNWWRLYFKHREKFKFDLKFIIERLRNVAGYIKASNKISN